MKPTNANTNALKIIGDGLMNAAKQTLCTREVLKHIVGRVYVSQMKHNREALSAKMITNKEAARRIELLMTMHDAVEAYCNNKQPEEEEMNQ